MRREEMIKGRLILTVTIPLVLITGQTLMTDTNQLLCTFSKAKCAQPLITINCCYLQHSPSSWIKGVDGSKLAKKTMKLGGRHCFGKQIGKLITGPHIMRSDVVGLNLLTNKMTINFDVFSSFVKYRVLGNMHGSLIVAKKAHWSDR